MKQVDLFVEAHAVQSHINTPGRHKHARCTRIERRELSGVIDNQPSHSKMEPRVPSANHPEPTTYKSNILAIFIETVCRALVLVDIRQLREPAYPPHRRIFRSREVLLWDTGLRELSRVASTSIVSPTPARAVGTGSGNVLVNGQTPALRCGRSSRPRGQIRAWFVDEVKTVDGSRKIDGVTAAAYSFDRKSASSWSTSSCSKRRRHSSDPPPNAVGGRREFG